MDMAAGISEARATGKARALSGKTVWPVVAFRCQKRPADRFDVISSEEVERRFERAAFDRCAGLPGDISEARRHRIRTIEANAQHAVAQRREDHAGLAAAIQHGGKFDGGIFAAGNPDHCLEPARPGIDAGAGRARHCHRDGERGGSGKRGARVNRGGNDDEAVGRVQPSLPKATAASTMRLENPHSLSYHDMTRHSRLPMTTVCVRSKVELCGSWLKSHDTVGSRLSPSMPLNRLDAAAFTISSLISSAEVSRAASNLKSITDTLAVGTRIEVPSSLPLSAGRTSPTALAAPVEVGIIDSAAARARRRSLCSVSTVLWSPV